MILNLAPGCPCSARYTPIPPKIVINTTRIARVTMSMFIFRIVKRRSILISNFLNVFKYILTD